MADVKDGEVQTVAPTVADAVTSEMIEQSKKIEGVKEGAANKEALEAIKKEAEENKEVDSSPIAYPSFFIEQSDKNKIMVDILFDKKKGNILSITKSNIGVDFNSFSTYGHCQESFEFTQPNYEDLSTYRQRCSSYNTTAKQMLIDGVQMRNYLLIWHLKDWSLRDKSGKKIELKHESSGALSDESMKAVYNVFPTLIDVALTIFEKEVVLS